MAKLTTDELIEGFKELSLIELSEFVKKFEEVFEVTAAAPVAVAAAGGGAAAPAEEVEEKDSFDVILEAAGDRRSRSSRRSVRSRTSAWARRRPSSMVPRAPSSRVPTRRPPRRPRPSSKRPARPSPSSNSCYTHEGRRTPPGRRPSAFPDAASGRRDAES